MLPPVSGNVAALLLGCSPRRVRSLVDSGVLPTEGGRIPTTAIEAHTGREITLADYGAAKAAVTSRYLNRRHEALSAA